CIRSVGCLDLPHSEPAWIGFGGKEAGSLCVHATTAGTGRLVTAVMNQRAQCRFERAQQLGGQATGKVEVTRLGTPDAGQDGAEKAVVNEKGEDGVAVDDGLAQQHAAGPEFAAAMI